ncbi:MAG: hypothetical protein JXX28_02070 [Deltaproteobacteria bacterium]|nr:hypothetical protein [Deltaproteobacteria bacterium]
MRLDPTGPATYSDVNGDCIVLSSYIDVENPSKRDDPVFYPCDQASWEDCCDSAGAASWPACPEEGSAQDTGPG